MASSLPADRCAINTATLGFQAPLTEVIEAVARAGFGAIAPWRREVEGGEPQALGRQIKDAGLKVTGYCRSTYIPALTPEEFDNHLAANYRAIADAAALGAESFVIVCGGLPRGSKDLAAARAQVTEAAGLLSDYARSQGVRIALEPLHPMYAADRSCLNTLAQARAVAEAAGADVGLCLDVYHIWWDPGLSAEIASCRGRILGLHVCDWLVPTQDMLNDRGMMGDGVIDIPPIRAAVEAAGFRGFTEVEIFSLDNWWKRPMAETLGVCRERLALC
jgi:sugar phosphate isomerase/epimerase